MTTVADRLLSALTDEQRAAATSEALLTVVEACPGSGKTSVLAARIAWLVMSKRVKPRAILCFAFTRAAAAELRDRLVTSIGEDQAEAVEITTFHAWALRLLRLNPAAAGLPAEFSIATEGEVEATTESMYEGGGRRPEASKVTRSALSDAMTEINAFGLVPEANPIGRLPSVLESRLLSVGLIDVASVPRRLLYAIDQERVTAPPDASSVADAGPIHEALARYRDVLVDEAQDATPAELRAVACVFARERTLLAMDPRQAIYGWRSAAGERAAAFVGASDRTLVVLPLTQCFRFGKEIALEANKIGAEINAQMPRLGGAAMKDIATGQPKGKVSRRSAADLRAVVEDLAGKHQPENVAVLCRTNALVETIAGELGALAQVVKRRRNPPWLEASTAVARLALNPSDDAAFTYLWSLEEDRCPWRGSLHALRATAGRARRPFAQYRAEFGSDSRERGTLLACAATIPLDGCFDDLQVAASKALSSWPYEGVAYDVGGKTLREALDAVALREEESGFESARREGRVTLSTVHAAKGREWGAVVVATDPFWPTQATSAENLRVYFVALTRARRELVILEPAGQEER